MHRRFPRLRVRLPEQVAVRLPIGHDYDAGIGAVKCAEHLAERLHRVAEVVARAREGVEIVQERQSASQREFGVAPAGDEQAHQQQDRDRPKRQVTKADTGIKPGAQGAYTGEQQSTRDRNDHAAAKS